MKLSQALIIRSDYQNKIYELKKRIINNSKVQEGENVSEDPMKLLKELNRVIDELDIITKRIIIAYPFLILLNLKYWNLIRISINIKSQKKTSPAL